MWGVLLELGSNHITNAGVAERRWMDRVGEESKKRAEPAKRGSHRHMLVIWPFALLKGRLGGDVTPCHAIRWGRGGDSAEDNSVARASVGAIKRSRCGRTRG